MIRESFLKIYFKFEDNRETNQVNNEKNKVHLPKNVNSNESINNNKHDNMGNTNHLHAKEDVKSVKLDLNSVYYLVPIASLILVTFMATMVVFIAKKTNIFMKKSQLVENRRQIYKSIATQDLYI